MKLFLNILVAAFELMGYWIMILILGTFGALMIMMIKVDNKNLKDALHKGDSDRAREAKKSLDLVWGGIPIVVILFLVTIILLINHFLQLFSVNFPALFVFGFGILFFYLGLLFQKSVDNKKAKYTGICSGTVVDIDEIKDRDGHVCHTAEISYIVNGQEYINSCGFPAGGKKAPEVGTFTDIYYNPKWPQEAESEYERGDSNQLPSWFLVIGIVTITIGLLLFTFMI